MANTKSAMKQMRQSERRRLRNRSIRSRIRSAVKVARETVSAPGSDAAAPGSAATAPGSAATAIVREALRTLDRAVTKGVIHANTAARKKSALARRLATHA